MKTNAGTKKEIEQFNRVRVTGSNDVRTAKFVGMTGTVLDINHVTGYCTVELTNLEVTPEFLLTDLEAII